jgi:hypothetical protein
MPQPDNQRQSGAATGTSTRNIGPTNQGRAANVSSINAQGGTVSAPSQVQIGQQGQIRQTGAELWQALQGGFKGASAGLEAYQKMYKIQSEVDYDKFQQSYVTEYDRVNGDPTKMKTWFDAQTYHPNRVTAGKFGQLRADVNGKAYEEDQRDLWMTDLAKTTTMSNNDALDYLSNRAQQEDPNSPWSRQAESRMIELSNSVADSTRRLNLSTMEMQYRGGNVSLVESLKADPRFAQSLGTEEFALVMANRSLGLVEIDSATGQISFAGSDQVFDLNSIGPNEMLALRETIGEYGASVDPELAMRALSAANLPASVLGKTPSTATPERKVVSQLRQALAGTDPLTNAVGVVNSFYGTMEPEDRLTRSVSMLGKTAESIMTDQDITNAERAQLLGEMQSLTVYDGSNPLWEGVDVDSQEELDLVLGEEFQMKLSAAREAAIVGSANDSFAGMMQAGQSAKSSAEMYAGFRFRFDNEILPNLAEVESDTRIFMTNPETGETEKITLDEYLIYGAGGDIGLQGFIPAGLEVVNPEFSEKVPFSFRMEGGKFVYEGSGNPQVTRQMKDLTDELNLQWQTARDAEAFALNASQTAAQAQRGFQRLVLSGSPEQVGEAFRIAGSPTRTDQDFFPSGGGPEADVMWQKAWARYNPDSLARATGEERVELLRELKTGFLRSPNLQERYVSEGTNPELVDTMVSIGPFLDPNLSPVEFQSAINAAHQARNSNTWNQTVAKVDSVVTQFGNLQFEQNEVGQADWSPLFTSEDPFHQAVIGRANTDYTNQYNRSLAEDLQSDSYDIRDRAGAFLTSNLQGQKDITRLANIGGAGSEAAVLDRLQSPIISSSPVITDANALYSNSEFNMTAQEEAVDMVIASFLEQDAIGHSEVARNLGLQTQADLIAFRSFLRTGEYTGLRARPGILRQFKLLREKLAEGIELEYADDPSGTVNSLNTMETDNGSKKTYQTHRWTIKLSPDVVRREEATPGALGMVSWIGHVWAELSNTMATEKDALGLTGEVFDSLPNELGLTLIRRQYIGIGGAPANASTGNQIFNQRVQYTESQRSDAAKQLDDATETQDASRPIGARLQP